MKKRIRKTKKVLAFMLTTVLMLTGLVSSYGQEVQAASSITITEAAGWLESAYVEWKAVSEAKGYAVYVKGASEADSAFKQLDSELIRQYASYWRADALGLPAGDYVMKVVAVMSDGATVGVQTSNLSVAAHDRSGFAWVNGTASGAYNEDGSLKSNAKVFYVTESTKDSLANELDSYADGNYPLCVRVIGEITDFSGMDKGDLLIDNGGNDAGLTIEGVGEDATANGWGIRIKNSSNVEIRNIGVMNCDSSEGDNIGLQQANDHIWVHNCDLFYGDAGSDADQVKGDGALDTKKSTYVTHSYNHFWDSGKCNLQGANSSDTSNYITYHHNWYDHSDSRHPRVRVATVHVYNNYYDGNAKYGIGSTTDSDIFAEANYFRNCKYPMMISGQGSDNMAGGTFSGEVGGMIKAYNNYIEGASSFISYQEDSSDFDAYVAGSRNEQLSSSVKNADGKSYNNFDTASGMYKYNVQSPQDAKASVEKYAGRVNGGDFKWEFNDSVEDTNYDVITELKSALTSYATSLVSVGGYEGSVDVPEGPAATTTPSATEKPAATTKPTTAPTAAPTQAPSGDGADYVHNFTTDGKSSNFFSITGNLSTSKGTVSYNGLSLTQCLKIESATNISFTVESDAKLVLVFNAANSSNIKVDDTKYNLSDGILTMDIAAGTHTITKADTANLYYMAVSAEGSSSGSTTPTAAPTAVPTGAPTAKPTAAPTQAPTPKPTSAPTQAPTTAPDTSGAAYTGSVTITGANWWTAMDISKADLLGSVDASDVTVIQFSADTDFFIGYNSTDGYKQPSGQKEYSLTDVTLNENYFLQLALSKNDNVNYTITWEVYTGTTATAAPTQAPTAAPTQAPTAAPTQAPTAAPTQAPTAKPTAVPTSVPTQAPTQAPAATTTYVHNFTTDGKSSDFFSITGNLSTSKGTVSYNGLSLTQCLKIESATNISFMVESDAELVLVFNAANSSNIKVDDIKYTLSNGILTMDIAAGTHTITKADTANLYYMAVNAEGSSSGPAATPTAAPSATPIPTQTPAATPKPTAAPTQTPGTGGSDASGVTVTSVGGWNETLYLQLSGIQDAGISAVSYSGPTSGSLTGDDFTYLVRDVDGEARIDIPGLKAGTYSVTVQTTKGTVTRNGITVNEQDRSGYAHFNYTRGVGAYNDDGTLKDNAIVLYVTNDNKDSVSITSKDGTTVTGIGHILNSAGKDAGNGQTSKGGKPNNNAGIIKKLAQDGTPLVIRILGNVAAPKGLTAYDSVDYGGSVGDNGYMARMQSGKDITIEGIGNDAVINGWGLHFIAESAATDLGESFEVRNITFRNVPEDCIGMEGVQSDSTLTAPVERCWIHNCAFYAPSISNPAESDKDGGDGACDFKRGYYFTNSYCYYEGYHKTNLVGASDSNLQYHITFHHNYWKNCESRGPLARQANIHMYNNVFEGQTSYCMNPRANTYIFSEYNIFENSKNPMQIKSGAIKSYNDTFINCRGDQDGTIVSSRSTKVSSNNAYENFDTDSALSYIPSGDYHLDTNTSALKQVIVENAGTME